MNFNYTWIMSALTLFTMYLAGNKNKHAWVIGLFNQILWAFFIYQTQALGLIPMTIALVGIYTKNLYQWGSHEQN